MKKNKIIILLILIVVIIFVLMFIRNFSNNITTNHFKINVEKLAIVTPESNDIFYENVRDEYKGYKLIFISAELKNNTKENFSNLRYELSSSNNNKYNMASSYITNNEEFINNYYKINEKIFDDSTKDLLGSKNKRIIVGFMIPENELNNDTTFTLSVEPNDIKYGEVQPLEFNTNEIITSNTMKELYKEDELEKAEQTIGLAYFVSLNDWQQWTIFLEQSYNYKDDNLFTVAFTTINVFAESSNNYIGWNGRKIDDENGIKLNFDTVKAMYPDISTHIEATKNTVNAIIELYSTYTGTINSLDINKLKQIDLDIVNNIFPINEFFELEKILY